LKSILSSSFFFLFGEQRGAEALIYRGDIPAALSSAFCPTLLRSFQFASHDRPPYVAP